jgi:hypothetical protein
MNAQLIVVSNLDQRLIVQAQPLAVQSILAPGDSYTSLVVQRTARARPPPPPPPPPPKGPMPEPPIGIGMDMIGGLPTGITRDMLVSAERITGPVTIDELATHLDAIPAGGLKILILEP